MEIDSSSDDDDDAHRPAPTEIDAAIDEGAAELQRLRDRRAKKVRGTSAAVSIVPTISGGGSVGDKLAQTLRRTVGGGRAPTAHRRDRASDTRLHAAVKVGDAVVVSQLLQGSARGQLNARQGSDGNTPLHLATIQSHVDVVELLLDAKANPSAANTWGHTALDSAAQHNRWNVLEQIGGQPEHHRIPVKAAVKHKQWGAVVALLEAESVQLDDVTSDPSVLLLKCAGGGGTTTRTKPLLRLIDLLLEADADLRCSDEGKETALHIASWAGNVDIVTSLLAAAADPTAKNDKGMSALHIAAESRNEELVTELLVAGLTARVHDEAWSTPLHLACRNGTVGSVKELLESGADPNAQTLARRTPLHFTRDVAVFQLLLGAGAHADCVDQKGKMPVDVALDVGNTVLVAQYLRPSALAIFASHRPGCCTTFDIVQERFPEEFTHVLDMVVAGVAENNAAQVLQVAANVRSQLLRQQQLWSATAVKFGGGGNDLESKEWVDQLDGRLAHLESYVTDYIERLVTCCSFPIANATVAKMDAMLINPTVDHIRDILMRLLTELDTAASFRTITLLHKKAQRAHEAAFEKSHVKEHDSEDFDAMLDAFDHCLEEANLEQYEDTCRKVAVVEMAAAAFNGGSLNRSSATSLDSKKRKKHAIRQPADSPLELILKARAVYPVFEEWMHHACGTIQSKGGSGKGSSGSGSGSGGSGRGGGDSSASSSSDDGDSSDSSDIDGTNGAARNHAKRSIRIPGVSLEFVTPSKPIVRMIVEALLMAEPANARTAVGAAAHTWRRKTAQYTGRDSFKLLALTDYAAQLDIGSVVVKCTNYKAMKQAISSLFKLNKDPDAPLTVVKANNTMEESKLKVGQCREVLLNVAVGRMPGAIIFEVRFVIERIATKSGDASTIRALQQLLELFAYMEKWGSPSTVSSAASAAVTREDKMSAATSAAVEKAQLEEDNIVLLQENEKLRIKCDEHLTKIAALEAQLDAVVTRRNVRSSVGGGGGGI